jgi:hypothetical protein
VKPGRSKSPVTPKRSPATASAGSWMKFHTGLTELNEGRGVPHPAVVKWLRSWGKKPERKAPRA